MKKVKCLISLFAIAIMVAVSFSSNGTQTAKADYFGYVEMVCQDVASEAYLLQADRGMDIQYVLCVSTVEPSLIIREIYPVAEPTEIKPLYIQATDPEKGALFWYSSTNEILKTKFLITDYVNGNRLIC